MRLVLSGIALVNGLKLKGNAITCTAKHKSNKPIQLTIKKQSKLMRNVQLISLLILLFISLTPDSLNSPEVTLWSLVVPLGLFMLSLRLIPNLRILNYHGAEHKVVVAYRKRLPLTLESVKPLSRVTPICGTMLVPPIVFLAFILSILGMVTENLWCHLGLTSLLLLLLGHYFMVRGNEIAYINLHRICPLPFIKKSPYKLRSNVLYGLFDQVGYYLQQYYTTREPSDEELKVALICMQKLIDELHQTSNN